MVYLHISLSILDGTFADFHVTCSILPKTSYYLLLMTWSSQDRSFK